MRQAWRLAAFGTAGIALAFGGVVFGGAAYLLRRRKPDPFDPPTNYNISYQDVSFLSRDGIRLRGWWLPAAGDGDQVLGTIIVCAGQDGSMEGDTAQVVALHRAGFNVLMFDWRGHGRSEGELVTMGALEVNDLLGAVDYLDEQRGIKRVGVLGFSMGGAVALLTAAESARIATVVADSPYTELSSVLQHWAASKHLPSALIKMVISAASLLSKAPLDEVRPRAVTHQLLSLPILIIYGAADHLVQAHEIEPLLRALPCAIGWRVSGVGHRGAYRSQPDEYDRRIVEWFTKKLAG